MKSVSHRRLPAAIPIAIAGILVVASVAFGATVMHSFAPPQGSASPVVVGDDNPTDAVTPAPTNKSQPSHTAAPISSKAPTASPTPGELELTAQTLPGKVKLTWSVFTGADFAYYKVVRSKDATVSWPLGDKDTLIAATDSRTTLNFTDPSGSGTFSYRVFAVKSQANGNAVLAASPVRTVAVAPATQTPTPTASPTAPPASPSATLMTFSLTANRLSDGVHLSWSKYTDANFQYYGVVRSEAGDPTWPLTGDSALLIPISCVEETAFTDKAAASGRTYHYRVYVRSTSETILAVSNIATLAIQTP
jgi:hypothetical protein